MHDHKANKHMHCFFDVICQVQLFGFIFFITNFVCFINIKNVKNVHTKMSKMSTQKMSKNVKFQKRNFTCLSGIRNSGFLSAQNRLLFFSGKLVMWVKWTCCPQVHLGVLPAQLSSLQCVLSFPLPLSSLSYLYLPNLY